MSTTGNGSEPGGSASRTACAAGRSATSSPRLHTRGRGDPEPSSRESASAQSPSDTTAPIESGRRRAQPDDLREAAGRGARVVDDRADEREPLDGDQRIGSAGHRRAPPRVVVLRVLVPLEQEAGGVGRVREEQAGERLVHDAHPDRSQVLLRRARVGDLQTDRVHPATEALEERGHG